MIQDMKVIFVISLLLAGAARADLQPPVVTVELANKVTIVPGTPREVGVRLQTKELAPLTGQISARMSRPGDWIAEPTIFAATAGGGRSTVVLIPLRSKASLAAQEIQFTFDAGQDRPATTRAFLHPIDGGFELISIQEQLARESVGQKILAGRKHRVFPLEARGAPEARPGKDVLKVTGTLSVTSYGGGTLVPRRTRAVLSIGGNEEGAAIAETFLGADGRFTLEVPARTAPSKLVVTFITSHARWLVGTSSDEPYAWSSASFEATSGEVDLGSLAVPADQVAKEAFWIQDCLNKALDVFEADPASGDMAWWTQIPVLWPESGDYYSWGSVHISLSHQWDVVGHEFGHAIFHYGSSSQSSGGSHKIDQCYGKTLAWSEGWASYFATVCHVAPDDPDAKFEFMVPRRKPIRIENVPEDVCQGDKNEWRVAAALWDLHDSHEDGEDKVSLGWAVMWKAMHEGQSLGSIKDYVTTLKTKLDATQHGVVDAAVRSNTIH